MKRTRNKAYGIFSGLLGKCCRAVVRTTGQAVAAVSAMRKVCSVMADLSVEPLKAVVRSYDGCTRSERIAMCILRSLGVSVRVVRFKGIWDFCEFRLEGG